VSVTTTQTAEAQASFGAYGVRVADSFDGANGVGVQAAVAFPILPIEAYVAGERFFPDCPDDGCSMWGGSVGINLKVVPLPIVQGYVTGGLVRRRIDPGGVAEATTDEAIHAGVGVSAGVPGLKAFLEGRYEFFDGDLGQFVVRLGVMF
jgi:hypothetical protein